MEAELTPSLRSGQLNAHVGHKGLAIARVRMRRTKDPPPPPDHVQQDGLGFEQVVAGALGIESEGLGQVLFGPKRNIVIVSQRASRRRQQLVARE
mmetsp:Transcript_32979/g.99452  ORF Transcript_32979/g.99452 Transcript_32979/m.99452 type:complete len:95 (-) Transcript_32979:391-675(-)